MPLVPFIVKPFVETTEFAVFKPAAVVDNKFNVPRRSRRSSSNCFVSASTLATAKLSSFSFSLKRARIESRSLPENSKLTIRWALWRYMNDYILIYTWLRAKSNRNLYGCKRTTHFIPSLLKLSITKYVRELHIVVEFHFPFVNVYVVTNGNVVRLLVLRNIRLQLFPDGISNEYELLFRGAFQCHRIYCEYFVKQMCLLWTRKTFQMHWKFINTFFSTVGMLVRPKGSGLFSQRSNFHQS